MRLTRRGLLAAVGLPAAVATAGCRSTGSMTPQSGPGGAPSDRGRLTFRPRPASTATVDDAPTGRIDLSRSLGASTAVAYVPTSATPLRAVVVLHGAGGEPRTALGLFDDLAEEHGLLVLALKSLDVTWDVIRGGFGPDVRRIDRVLTTVSERYAVSGYTIAGFSDGASYALTLGLTNGDVFDSVVAFSPGFTAGSEQHGAPRIFISHGTHDEVLPIDRCSRRIVPQLRRSGHDVTYAEFQGGHHVPPELRSRAASWLSG